MILSWRSCRDTIGKIFFPYTSTRYDSIDWSCHFCTPCSDIIDPCLRIGTVCDRIFIFSRETFIPFSIRRSKFSYKSLSCREDFLLGSEEEWIVWCKCFVLGREFDNDASWSRDRLSGERIFQSDFYSIFVVAIK